MNKHDAYVNDKTMLAYEKYLKGEYFLKARAIILKDGEVAFIKDLSNDNLTVPGGGVDENESLEEATIREAMEETNIIVKPIMVVGEEYYEVPMQIGDVDFLSPRIAYACLCEYIDKKEGKNGLEGEYAGETEIFFDNIDRLKECHISDEAVQKIKEYVMNKAESEKE